MALTYNGVTPKEITYNGATVKTVVCNGATIWQRNKEFTLSSAYLSSNVSAFETATSTTKVTTLSENTNGRLLLLTETTTNSRVPILYYHKNSSTWALYWIGTGSWIKVQHTFNVYTDSKIILSTASTGTYIDVCSDANLSNVQRTLQPTCPFFEYYSSTTNSSGATVYLVRTVDMKDNTEFRGYVSSNYKSTIVNLEDYNVIDLV